MSKSFTKRRRHETKTAFRREEPVPEGPEIHRAVAAIDPVLRGRVARTVHFGLPRLERHARILEGRRIRGAEARGKAVIVRFSGGLNVYSHNQLYGRWYVRRDHSRPKTGRSLRFAIDTSAGSALLYSASSIEVLDDAELEMHPYVSKLGPDLLDPAVSGSQVLDQLRSDRFAGRRLAALLLDQAFLAGLGNYLRSEILFVARIDPERRPRDLEPAEERRLARAALTISRRSFETGGITNDLRRAARLKKEGWPRRRYRHHVFARAGEPCFECGGEIDRLEAAGRRIYVCPSCQR